jgi:hypothetical protein
VNVYAFDGPVVVLPARVCAVLEEEIDLDRFRKLFRDRGDLETHDALQAVRAVGNMHNETVAAAANIPSDARTPVAPESEVAARSEAMVFGSDDVASVAGISSRAVTLAASRGRLRGVLVSGRWWFNPDDVVTWLATRTKERAA